MKKEKAKVNPYISIGSRIRKVRVEKNIDKSILATALGVTEADIDSIEEGKSRLTMDALFAISKVLETEMNYFLTGIPNSRIIIASDILDKYIEAFKFIDGLSDKQKQVFSEMLENLNSSPTKKLSKK
ncbi:MAG: helix-turn-helix transcriptional regulator [Alphaproteobacteria bacterium]|nr:helix-turn-helix transcriptional regulator [Alphaproteobacteria bacterium]